MQPRIRGQDWALSCFWRDGVDSQAGAVWGDVEAQRGVDLAGSGKLELLPWCFSAQSMCSVPEGSLASPRNAHVRPVCETGRREKAQTETGERQEKEKAEKGEEGETPSAQLPAHGEWGGHCPSSPRRHHHRGDARGQFLCLGSGIYLCSPWEIFAPTAAASLWCGRSRAVLSCRAVSEMTEMIPGCSLQGKKLLSFFFFPTKRQKLPLKLLKKSKPTKQCSALL